MSDHRFNIENWEKTIEGSGLIIGSPECTGFDHVAFDTRKIADGKNTLFIALKGENRDGHRFISKAYSRGVRNFLVNDKANLPENVNALVVKDTLEALQKIATEHRKKFKGKIIGITGSNGKTIVKEWLAEILSAKYNVFRSPGSYNSQLGVALSLLELENENDVALIEAGISRPGEMAVLQQMIMPDEGIFTHFGDAHAEGFATREIKLLEKQSLFRESKLVYVSLDNDSVAKSLFDAEIPVKTCGLSKNADLTLVYPHEVPGGWKIELEANRRKYEMDLALPGAAALDNVLLVILAAMGQGMSMTEISKGLKRLHPVSMRMELITDNPEITIINDAYTADISSVRNAFALLEHDKTRKMKAVILSDLDDHGAKALVHQRELMELAISKFGNKNVWLIGPKYVEIAAGDPRVNCYPDTSFFLADFDYDLFRNHAVLLKGARKFGLEEIVPWLSRRAVVTFFKINLNHLSHNFRQFRQRIPEKVKLMAMVKAFAYGSGTWEIAQALEMEGVDYLAVAYTSEGIDLRLRGISTPIMIMNADPQNITQLYRYGLEPEVYNLDFLKDYSRIGRDLGETPRVHIKIDTGMRRLGFRSDELGDLRNWLAENTEVEVASVMSHLAAADESEYDDFTREQISKFEDSYASLFGGTGKTPDRHILNTAGIMRFSEKSFEMVRLGIGLYGVSPSGEDEMDLREIGSLHSKITQIHEYEAGTSIGYGRSEELARKARIATVPVGYADGLRRSLSNGKAKFLVRGKRVPTVGRVCMDMLMLDITDVPGVREGDEVVFIGSQNNVSISVEEIAERCGTIAYEILTGISQRVRRIYVRE